MYVGQICGIYMTLVAFVVYWKLVVALLPFILTVCYVNLWRFVSPDLNCDY